jgi:hypothetical protein
MKCRAFFLVVLSSLLPLPAHAIVGGKASTAADDAVVLVLTHIPAKDTAQGQYFENCTGTLLAPNIVLTARHCVTASTDGSFRCKSDGTIEPLSGGGGRLSADLVPSDALVFVGPKLPDTATPDTANAKGKAYVHDDGTVTCNHDVALIILDRAIPNAKLAPIRLDRGVKKGDALTVVGWGATEKSFIPSGRQKRTGVSVVDVGPSEEPRVGGTLAEKEFIATESVCTGDSGGPAFSATTGAVVGVVSRGENTTASTNGSGCLGTEHTFMQVNAFADLVTKAFAQAGGQPIPETQPQAATPDAGEEDPVAPPAEEPAPSGSSGGCNVHASSNGSATAILIAFYALVRGARAKRSR